MRKMNIIRTVIGMLIEKCGGLADLGCVSRFDKGCGKYLSGVRVIGPSEIATGSFGAVGGRVFSRAA